jgi:UPF0755 protein
MRNPHKSLPILPIILLLFIGSLFATGIIFTVEQFSRLETRFGPASTDLGGLERMQLSLSLVLDGENLFNDGLMPNSEIEFNIASGEGVNSILQRLAELGVISDQDLLRNYLLYSGLDTQVRAGDFVIDGEANSIEIAQSLLVPNPGKLSLTIFPGWRLEEIAESLQEAGFSFDSDDFLRNDWASADDFDILYSLPEGQSLEGYFLSGTYLFDRDVNVEIVISALLKASSESIDDELLDQLAAQGLSLHEALTLASIIEREARIDDEKPLIASVFLNRLSIGMRLEADPTVQYPLGYDEGSESWWTAPILGEHLSQQSAYNTYQIDGLPPGPIASSSLTTLLAIAFPAESDYLFFQAACDNSGVHVFAFTFEEHIANNCP